MALVQLWNGFLIFCVWSQDEVAWLTVFGLGEGLTSCTKSL